MKRHGILAAAVAACMAHTVAFAEDDFVIDIGGISFDELINTTITSVSKKEQRLQDAAAAIFVLTAEDLRRARATTVADALRLVPGVHVVSTDANSWGISIRGFNTSVFNNKLLILVDGRSVYDPLFAGTFWDLQDPVLEDIDRIEVIRGPGGTLWGSNAVAGVINIITKSAKDTQGGLVVAGTGTEERVISTFRHGAELENGGHYRLYGKFNERDEGWHASGAQDDWRIGKGGFRFDKSLDGGVTHTLQGDIFDARTGPTTGAAEDNRYYGGNLIYRWSHNADDGSGQTVQLYYDYFDLDNPGIEEQRDTVDFEYQRNMAPRGGHSITWGLGARYLGDRVTTDGATALLLTAVPEESEDQIYSLFAQDEISLLENRLKLTVGAKLEENDFTGLEIQPNLRFAWSVDEKNTYWGAVSRAVRIPTRLESDFPSISDNDLDAEELVAYELGWRKLAGNRFSLDTTLFYNAFDEVIIFDTTGAVAPVPNVLGIKANNALEGESYGAEISARWQAREWWRMEVGLTYLQVDLKAKSGFTALNATAENQAASIERSDPHHRATLVSQMELSDTLSFDTVIRYSDNISGPGGPGSVPSYVVFDMGITWKPAPELEINLGARNLGDNHHPEAVGTTATAAPTRSEVQHSVFGTVTWRY